MNQVSYNTQFNGQFTAANDNGTVLKSKTIAPAGSIVIERGSKKKATREVLEGAEVRSTVIYTGKDTFQQYGVISFGDGRDTLHFSTEGKGRIAEDADRAVKRGAAILRIDYGHGRFAQATGRIASNFSINDNGDVTDTQVGVVAIG